MLNDNLVPNLTISLKSATKMISRIADIHIPDKNGLCKGCHVGHECWGCGEWGCDGTPCQCDCHVYWPCATVKIILEEYQTGEAQLNETA